MKFFDVCVLLFLDVINCGFSWLGIWFGNLSYFVFRFCGRFRISDFI